MRQSPPMDLKDRIRKARNKVGMSQTQLAIAVGVSRGAVAQWEGGGSTGKGPTTENLAKIARVTMTPASELIGEPGFHDSGLDVRDPTEVAVVELLRRLPEGLRQAHLALLYQQLGATEAPKRGRKPPKGGDISN